MSIVVYNQSFSNEVCRTTVKIAQNHLNERRKTALEKLEESGADHVVYAAKQYDNNGNVSYIMLYMEPMDDDTFYHRTRRDKRLIYAVHRRK